MLTTTTTRLLRPTQQAIRRSSTTSPANNTPEQPNLIYPDPQTPQQHHDLPSFLTYAARTELDPKSTTFVGTHYEYSVQASLRTLGMSLKRVGGRSDHGIDLLGTWTLPSSPVPLKVLIQCKAFARPVEPSQARELEGAFVGAPIGWRGEGVLGFLVSRKPATKGVREAIGRSRWPMGYVMCDERDGRVLQMLWNRRAEGEGLEGIEVGLKYSGGEKSEKEVVLLWKGDAIKPSQSPD